MSMEWLKNLHWDLWIIKKINIVEELLATLNYINIQYILIQYLIRGTANLTLLSTIMF